ncbi:hydroxymethylbilane synthase [Stenotrophomonas acidaminiphila]|jgi:hydroxymethylbilane synthase|uniref:Porphobilinogen deaminase n=1 Tax=Stenotrophomonas acidaminiphila TaxID=128780 RepID=A0A0R0E861_9GAMM|nr:MULTISPECIES: hydroxymethylbilane synthase [Stenotrophomonas]OZB52488.1 MAG: hydroxymethylbilane synthase [Stenotrophomonas sp. 14-69-23]ALJ27089.1 Porphobilinogen deaminase [Stenotrophomonas acidaminiphila]KRG87127.1 porphobilinogen deaminase [Stenotrophomonas acidaminiphila]QOF99083.1 hydroxymethylbilane synthase [Stenotrophomonas sp. CW117]WHL19382.1 hydroxymethylbilane synthase [Stenotrophomonas acidaminiphila]
MNMLRIATRKSPLALWQSEHVAARLRQAHPGLSVELVPMSTRGDEVLDRSLAAIGGKGLFLKELELAMLRGEADCAVHSLKDVPMELDAPFALPAILERADPADAFVSNRHATLDALPHGAVVGTSSLRRQAQLRALRPDLQARDLRGNVNTRLAKLDAGDYDAIILACAGLERLELGTRIRDRLRAPQWLPAPAQAAVAVECRADAADVIALLAVLDHAGTRACVEAERAMNRALDGSCHVPVAGLAQWRGEDLWLQGLVGGVADGRAVRAQAQGPGNDPEALGRDVARQLLDGGAGELLR